MTMLNAALAAQARGFHIFPVARGAKVPHPAAGEWGKTATNDRNQIEYFWTRVDPQANIGVACKPSQLLVVDLDVPKDPWKLKGTEWEYLHAGYGPYVSGEQVWDEIVYKLAGHDFPDTYTVMTPSGGIHLYYWWPATLGPMSQASPVKGVIDVRGNGGQWGGYVVGEGSRVGNGSYVDTRPGYQIAFAPDWLVEMVRQKPQQPAVRRPKGLMQPGAISWSGLVDSVRYAGQGNRNNALTWAVRTMTEEGADLEEIRRTLGPPAAEAGLGDLEIERTIESAHRTQLHKEGRG
jgi:hypothetical protein